MLTLSGVKLALCLLTMRPAVKNTCSARTEVAEIHIYCLASFANVENLPQFFFYQSNMSSLDFNGTNAMYLSYSSEGVAHSSSSVSPNKKAKAVFFFWEEVLFHVFHGQPLHSLQIIFPTYF